METTIKISPVSMQTDLFGAADSHLRLLRDSYDVKIVARRSEILITGKASNVEKAHRAMKQMQDHLSDQGHISSKDVKEIINQNRSRTAMKCSSPEISVYSGNKVIKANTTGQMKYIDSMLKRDLTFCTGPAGTGKTYLAVAVAVSMLKNKQVRRIVLARPAVEAGEKLGFLPGDLKAKVNPYLRPLFDALGDMMSFVQMKKFIELDIIEIIPLAFMRGRTLNDSVIICDEAQNTSALQMLMVLTRLGNDSKMIITGDITQSDLEKGQKSGLVDAIETLRRIKGIGCVELSQQDIVRHKLVQNIVRAYKKKAQVK
ncbi:MAG TPA: PhoH family protein [Sedimentisphaerales bacterium]|nr:PhoH family protein [Sedimentisphaerales bacterium]